MLIKLLVLGLITGTLIGTVGIGGILLSPLLVFLIGVDLHLAMAVSSWSFLFTGIVGTITYARKRTISWRMAGWLSLGIIPAAIFGAWTNSALPTTALTIILAILIAFSTCSVSFKSNTLRRSSFSSSSATYKPDVGFS